MPAGFIPARQSGGEVRSVKEYGSFIELAPNLSGLADAREDLRPGTASLSTSSPSVRSG